jgi:16S rRNA (uracil1498-N3)-methyltransferase
MKRVLCSGLPRPGHPAELSPTEAHHAVKVLRLRNGDRVEAIDGQGGVALATLELRGERVRLEHAGEARATAASAEQVAPLTLELAVLKGDAMEWAIEKAVELGVRRLVPVLTAHTVVQVGGKGPEAFRERWQRIADQALKQCGRLERLEVEPPIALEEMLARPLAAGEARACADEAARDGGAPPLSDWLSASPATALRFLIGPEGGWSVSERELLERSTERVSLGPNVLRAETAALFAASLAVARLRARRD